MHVAQVNTGEKQGENHAVMQDRLGYVRSENGDAFVAVVCDGHGLHGEAYAETIKERVLHIGRTATNPELTNLLDDITGALINLQTEIEDGGRWDKLHGGSTVTAGIVTQEGVGFAALGNTVARYFKPGQAPAIKTFPHNFANEFEIERLQALGLDVSAPSRENPHPRLGDLDITASIGDVGLDHLLRRPQQTRMLNREAPGLLVIGTDGIFNAATYDPVDNAVQAAMQEGRVDTLAQALATEFGDRTGDDASCIVLGLEHEPQSPPAAWLQNR